MGYFVIAATVTGLLTFSLTWGVYWFFADGQGRAYLGRSLTTYEKLPLGLAIVAIPPVLVVLLANSLQAQVSWAGASGLAWVSSVAFFVTLYTCTQLSDAIHKALKERMEQEKRRQGELCLH